MTTVLSLVDREVAYMEKSWKFYKKRICRDEQTNFEYKQNPINIFLAR